MRESDNLDVWNGVLALGAGLVAVAFLGKLIKKARSAVGKAALSDR